MLAADLHAQDRAVDNSCAGFGGACRGQVDVVVQMDRELGVLEIEFWSSSWGATEVSDIRGEGIGDKY